MSVGKHGRIKVLPTCQPHPCSLTTISALLLLLILPHPTTSTPSPLLLHPAFPQRCIEQRKKKFYIHTNWLSFPCENKPGHRALLTVRHKDRN